MKSLQVVYQEDEERRIKRRRTMEENTNMELRRSSRIANALKQKEMIAAEALLSLKNARL
jgi:hypothetical protein